MTQMLEFLQTERNWPFLYVAVGLIYWAINVFVRKLPEKNEPEDGWILSPFWLVGWPICFAGLATLGVIKIKDKLTKSI